MVKRPARLCTSCRAKNCRLTSPTRENALPPFSGGQVVAGSPPRLSPPGVVSRRVDVAASPVPVREDASGTGSDHHLSVARMSACRQAHRRPVYVGSPTGGRRDERFRRGGRVSQRRGVQSAQWWSSGGSSRTHRRHRRHASDSLGLRISPPTPKTRGLPQSIRELCWVRHPFSENARHPNSKALMA